jgi:cobalt-zinc-cadmium efflux system protein
VSGTHAHHHHDHTHHHTGAHEHSHAHGGADFGRAFAIGTTLNLAFVIVEAAYGVIGDSVALLADAGHNLGDVLGLAAAWGAHALATRRPTARYTYGLGRASILAALFNAALLLVAIGGIAWEAIGRFLTPHPTDAGIVIALSLAGILVNGFTAWLFAAGRKDDLNIHGAFLHMVADAAVSAAVAAAGVGILFTGWLWLDPAVSLIVCAVIAWGTWGLLRDSVRLSLDAVPGAIDAEAVRQRLAALPGVSGIHDLHIWPMSTRTTALTCHLVMPQGHPGDAFLRMVADDMRARFSIGHSTVQIECDEDGACEVRCATGGAEGQPAG